MNKAEKSIDYVTGKQGFGNHIAETFDPPGIACYSSSTPAFSRRSQTPKEIDCALVRDHRL